MAETTYRPFGKTQPLLRLIVRRFAHPRNPARPVRRSLLPRVRDRRDGDTVELEADHRRHAVVEDAIHDLKYGVGLNHMPSGRFGAMPPGSPST